MEHLLSLQQPTTPIVFDYAKFLISSKKTADIKAYGPIVTRLGFSADSFLTEMKKFTTEAATRKTNFNIDKVCFCPVLLIFEFLFMVFVRCLRML